MYHANLDYKVTEHENCEFLYHIFFPDEIIKYKRRYFTVLFQSKYLNSRELKIRPAKHKRAISNNTQDCIIKLNLEIIIYMYRENFA